MLAFAEFLQYFLYLEVILAKPVLSGKKGLILFEVHGWLNANGHATLFNGMTCYDHCYFNEPGAKYRTTKANFWALK
jgi:hypothetical protein